MLFLSKFSLCLFSFHGILLVTKLCSYLIMFMIKVLKHKEVYKAFLHENTANELLL